MFLVGFGTKAQYFPTYRFRCPWCQLHLHKQTFLVPSLLSPLGGLLRSSRSLADLQEEAGTEGFSTRGLPSTSPGDFKDLVEDCKSGCKTFAPCAAPKFPENWSAGKMLKHKHNTAATAATSAYLKTFLSPSIKRTGPATQFEIEHTSLKLIKPVAARSSYPLKGLLCASRQNFNLMLRLGQVKQC